MSFLNKLHPRRKKSDADAQFLRFLKLNYREYADFCVFGRQFATNLDVALACREWIPSLSKRVHRDICESIALLHEASAKKDAAMDSLMTSLDRMAHVAPTDYAQCVSPVRKTRFARPSTLPQLQLSSDIMNDASLMGEKAKKGLADHNRARLESLCNYCGIAAGNPTTFLSGEPASVCDSKACVDMHDELVSRELKDYRKAGLLSVRWH